MGNDEPEWVELRRFVDPIEAEITSDFLKDHGIDVMMRGNSTNIVALHNLNSIIDMRLTVPRAQLEEAREVLAAMKPPADAVVDAPPSAAIAKGTYRTQDEDDEELDPHRPKFKVAAFLLAFLVPIGGGHFYARHTGAGAVLAATNVICFLLAFSQRQWLLVPLILVVADALLGLFAVRRYNEKRIPGEPVQALVTALGAALVVAIVWNMQR